MGTAINFSIGGSNKKFVAVAKDTQSRAARMAQNVTQRIGAMSVAAGVLIAKAVSTAARAVMRMASRMGEGLRAAFDLGGSLSDLSSQTGAAVKDLLILQQAFKNNGVATTDMQMGFARMQRALFDAAKGSGVAAKTFSQLGINMQEISKSDPVTQFRMIGDAIMRLQDPTTRTAMAMQIFGRSGAKLLTVFNDGSGMDVAAEQLGKQADLLQKNANKFDEISDRMASSGLALQGFFVGLASVLADPLLKLLQEFAKIDLAEMGQKAGKAILDFAQGALDAWNALLNGVDLFQAGVVKLMQWGMQAINYVAEGVSRVWDLIRSGWSWLSGGVASLLSDVTEGVMALAVEAQTAFQYAFSRVVRFFDDAMGPVIDNVSAALEFAMQKALEGLSKIPFLKKQLGLEGFQAQSFETIRDAKAADRADRQSQTQKSYSEMRAENNQADWVQAGMNAVIGMRNARDQQMTAGADAFNQGIFGPKAPVFDSSMIAGVGQFAVDKAQASIDRGPAARIASMVPTAAGAADPADWKSRIPQGPEFGATRIQTTASPMWNTGKPTADAGSGEQEKTNEKLDELIRAFEGAWGGA